MSKTASQHELGKLIRRQSLITQFDEQAHAYTHKQTRQIVPSVTQVLDATGFGEWKRFITPEALELAQLRGRAVHACCELINRDDLDESSVSEPIRPYVEAYKEWKEQSGYKPLWVEQAMINPRKGFGLMPDSIGIAYDELAIVDTKTSTVVNKSVALQLAGYADGIDQNTIRRYSLRLGKDGRPRIEEYRVIDLLTRDLAAWKSALTLWKWRNDVRTSSSAAA